jgi:hypothetical protein
MLLLEWINQLRATACTTGFQRVCSFVALTVVSILCRIGVVKDYSIATVILSLIILCLIICYRAFGIYGIIFKKLSHCLIESALSNCLSAASVKPWLFHTFLLSVLHWTIFLSNLKMTAISSIILALKSSSQLP